MKPLVPVALTFLMFAGCASAPAPTAEAPPSAHPVQQATLWMQTAGEYRAAALQAWRAAEHTLKIALADPNWTAATEQGEGFAALPPAIVVDADETVIDNSPFEAALVLDGAEYTPPRWSKWVAERRATAVPGALPFLQRAHERGVTVFYVTNRNAEDEAATRDNLRALGFPMKEGEDVVLTRGEHGGGSEKQPRRAHVAERYRIVLMAGDDMNDFVAGTRTDPAARAAVLERYRSYWGERWIVLPNPMYGSWERALYGFESGLTRAEKQRRLRQALRR